MNAGTYTVMTAATELADAAEKLVDLYAGDTAQKMGLLVKLAHAADGEPGLVADLVARLEDQYSVAALSDIRAAVREACPARGRSEILTRAIWLVIDRRRCDRAERRALAECIGSMLARPVGEADRDAAAALIAKHPRRKTIRVLPGESSEYVVVLPDGTIYGLNEHSERGHFDSGLFERALKDGRVAQMVRRLAPLVRYFECAREEVSKDSSC